MSYCPQHSGFDAKIENLERSVDDQWKAINQVKEKYDGVMVRLNVLLGTLVVGVIVLTIQIFFKK